METKNIYVFPVDKKTISKIITKAPTHLSYHSNEFNADFDSTNAVDFYCELNTPVMAAADGEVVWIQDDVTKNWPTMEDPPPEKSGGGNTIQIRHENNEYSMYLHLKQHSMKVKVGDKVKTGNLIAYSGLTGWTKFPHLHFMVIIYTKPPPSRDSKSLPIKWSDKKTFKELKAD